MDLDHLPDESVCWRARVVQMDGRRIDLLELTELRGHAHLHGEPGEERGSR
ncbi:membrane domain protein [Mycobacterium kansasii]|uniref:Membrane domain protein n=1 Tax=Mycobacterium kansasii TaxID=1768 RepID=A0A1V3X3D2_MYCKA|nr:membrane domain protein [Mycobacterium kansasii]